MRRRSVVRVAKKKRDLVWVTAFGSMSLTENATTLAFLSAGEWEASSLNFERATLLRVRGYMTLVQFAAASVAAPVALFAIHLGPITYVAGDFDPLVSSDYDITDVLWTDGVGLTPVAATQSMDMSNTRTIDIKAKRRMTSAQQLMVTGSMQTDGGANPSLVAKFLLRCLVDRT